MAKFKGVMRVAASAVVLQVYMLHDSVTRVAACHRGELPVVALSTLALCRLGWALQQSMC